MMKSFDEIQHSLIPGDFNPNQLSSLNLAFVGDTVFDLFIRSALVRQANRPVKQLQQLASQKVNAASQAKMLEKISSVLTDEEKDIVRRGKNAHVRHYPKGASHDEYHAATALEALFGHLYLSSAIERLEELFSLCISENN